MRTAVSGRLVRASMVAAFLVAGGASAAADSVLVAIAPSDLPAKAEIRASAEAAVREVGSQVVPLIEASKTGMSADALAACSQSDSLCAQREAVKSGASRVLLLKLADQPGKAGTKDVVMTGWIISADSGTRLEVGRRFCERCGSAERLAEISGDLAAALLSGDADRLAPETWLEVRSSPPSAEVTIDGSVMGLSGQAYRVTPGTVAVKVARAGYQPVTLDVTVAPNATKVIQVELHPVATSVGPSDGLKRNDILKYSALGAGAVAAGVGITLMAVDGPRFDSAGNRLSEERNTLIPGVLCTAVGAALITTSAILWLQQSDDHEGESTLVAAPTENGFAVGFTGVF
ncbi:MAG TPA: PEGA domain-containing protein [Kofleriaceae bacterium]|nr:PEGA domain-containing protein [Kofleriaceae bacterium]